MTTEKERFENTLKGNEEFVKFIRNQTRKELIEDELKFLEDISRYTKGALAILDRKIIYREEYLNKLMKKKEK